MLYDEHTKSLYSPCVPIIFPQRQESFPSVLPKRVFPVFLRMHNKFAQRKPAKHKKSTRGKISKRGSTIVSKTYNLEETFGRPKEGYSSLKLLLLPSITICLDMEQFVLVSLSVYNKSLNTQSVRKQELAKYQPSQNPRYQVDSLEKEINKKLFSKRDSLVDKILSCLRIRLSKSQTLILDGSETGIFLADFAQQLRRKNAEVPDNYFTLLDAAGLSPILILNQKAKTKETGSCVPFEI